MFVFLTVSTLIFHNVIGAEFGASNSAMVNEEDFEMVENWDINAFNDSILKGNLVSRESGSQPLILVKRLINSTSMVFQPIGFGTVSPVSDHRWRVSLQRRYCFSKNF